MTAHLKPTSIPQIVRPDELRHRAFLQALADGDVASSNWLGARAGLLVLRYVDAWATGEWLPVQLMAERAAVADAIAEIPAGDQIRGLLAVLLERTATEWALTAAREPYALPPSVARVASPLLAYAHALQFSSQWALAADVYLLVWESCGPHSMMATRSLHDPESAVNAGLRLAACYRMLGEAERAGNAYAAAFALAHERGDERSMLRARLGEAKLVQDRGNFPRAEELISAVIRDTTTAQLQDIRACAFHDRSLVAYQRQNFRAAVEWGFEAWAIERNPRGRERVLCDLALALFGAGYRDMAKAAHRLLASTGQEPLIRWAATINLIEIATIERDEAEFERQRVALRSVTLPPSLAANYQYYIGQGDIVFARAIRGCRELERAMEIAERHGLGELVIKAEAALVALREGQVAETPVSAVPVPPEMAHISDALHGACAAALVGAD